MDLASFGLLARVCESQAVHVGIDPNDRARKARKRGMPLDAKEAGEGDERDERSSRSDGGGALLPPFSDSFGRSVDILDAIRLVRRVHDVLSGENAAPTRAAAIAVTKAEQFAAFDSSLLARETRMAVRVYLWTSVADWAVRVDNRKPSPPLPASSVSLYSSVSTPTVLEELFIPAPASPPEVPAQATLGSRLFLLLRRLARAFADEVRKLLPTDVAGRDACALRFQRIWRLLVLLRHKIATKDGQIRYRGFECIGEGEDAELEVAASRIVETNFARADRESSTGSSTAQMIQRHYENALLGCLLPLGAAERDIDQHQGTIVKMVSSMDAHLIAHAPDSIKQLPLARRLRKVDEACAEVKKCGGPLRCQAPDGVMVIHLLVLAEWKARIAQTIYSSAQECAWREQRPEAGWSDPLCDKACVLWHHWMTERVDGIVSRVLHSDPRVQSKQFPLLLQLGRRVWLVAAPGERQVEVCNGLPRALVCWSRLVEARMRWRSPDGSSLIARPLVA